jgi:photosystem II stability/assembly factor-like uncharacterized protein
MYPQWTHQNPVPDGNHLLSIFFNDDNTGWIVGSDGFIKKTTNAGLDWIQQNSGTTLSLKSVQFINKYTGWVCGEEGLIIKTTDGGQNWFSLSSGTTEKLSDLQFIDENIGYAVGFNETILKTTDGGISWIVQSTGTAFNLYSVDFVDINLGYAVGGKDSSNFLKTTDGGLNWTKKTLNLGSLNTPILNCVEFIDANVGWIGYGVDKYNANLTKTTDGGETWISASLSPISRKGSISHIENDNPFDIQVGIRSIYFKDSNNGYAVGGTWDGWNRCIYSTTDAGNTWQTKYNYSEQTGLLSVIVCDNGYGFVVGYSGVIYKTEDNGSSWSQILSGSNRLYYNGDWITSVFLLNDSTGWAGGFRKGIWYYPILLKTTNGGKIWETSLEFNNSTNKTSSNIFFQNENTGWVTFYGRGSYKTTDGGKNWLPSGNAGNEKYFINPDTGWGTYEPLGIFKSTDGGANWIQKSSVSSRSIHFSDNYNGWAVGLEGSILKSTDQGENWVSKTSGTTSKLNSVQFYDKNVGICVGNSGTVLISTDGGENWIPKSSCTTNELTSVKFTSANTVWIAGLNGTILNSTDLGLNWNFYNGVAEVDLASIYFINENKGWYCGDNIIFKYEDDVTPVELFSFVANIKDKKVTLSWQTATELNNYGFEIERRIDERTWDILGFVEGHGNSTSTNYYSFSDDVLTGGNKLHYRLKQIDIGGAYNYSNVIEVELMLGDYALYQNYPNPFNPSTKIRYTIPFINLSGVEGSVPVAMKVYDILGNEVVTLVNEKKEPGKYEVEFIASNLSSGTYIYRIVAGDPSTGSGQYFVETKKMVLMK